jgi:hypothetical protein
MPKFSKSFYARTGSTMPLRRPEPYGVCPLGGAQHMTVGCEGRCPCAGWGGMVRQLRPGYSIRTECGETHTLK